MSQQLKKTVDADLVTTKSLNFKQGASGFAKKNSVLMANGDGGTFFADISGIENLTPAFTTVATSSVQLVATDNQRTITFKDGENITLTADPADKSITIGQKVPAFQKIGIQRANADGNYQTERLLMPLKVMKYIRRRTSFLKAEVVLLFTVIQPIIQSL